MSGWKVIKYSNGFAIATLRSNRGAISLTTKKAEGVYSHPSYVAASVNLPSGLFEEIFSSNMNVESNGYTLSQINNVSTTAIGYRLWSSYSGSPSCIVSFLVTGRWK